MIKDGKIQNVIHSIISKNEVFKKYRNEKYWDWMEEVIC